MNGRGTRPGVQGHAEGEHEEMRHHSGQLEGHSKGPTEMTRRHQLERCRIRGSVSRGPCV